MNKKEKAQIILSTLDTLFPDPKPTLIFNDVYTLLVAVLLSAHTTDVSVNNVTPALFAKANTPQKMVKLKVQEIQAIIRTCGLSPKKAAYIWALSKILLEKHEGKVPHTLEELEELPGVGHKTASVVMIQGFHENAFPVDTHIHRLAKRWGLSKGKSVKETEQDLKKIFPPSTWNRLHLQMIYYGRRFCPARHHKKENCPLCTLLT